MTFSDAFKTISQLVTDFDENKKHYLNPSYSEADVRNDFINKFFIALGWDVRHETQKNPYEQEVRVEKPVQVAKEQKRADYTFYLKPNFRDIKFFVEAKKPFHGLENKDFFFQTIRYGWNANTPVAVLTDFEEFIILDCRYRPDINNILSAKIKRFHYSDYANEEKLKEIYFLFGRDAVADSSIEKYAAELPKPKGKAVQRGLFKGGFQPIDESFLEEIDEIRTSLAKSFKKNNSHLTSEELTEATQRTIDRLVFIKFLEDKLIEPDHYISNFTSTLPPFTKGRAGEGSGWEKFIRVSRTLDAKYNGVVFKKSLIDTRNIVEPDEKTFSQICEDLSHENTPYDFDKIPIHILGSIYERFLGKVVNATDKRVTIEEKPEVRKAGGVYYTPQYIVNYIVDNTVVKLIEGKTPKEIAKLRFADIACGSGSFLITVYERLIDYHKIWYQQNPEQAKKDGCILFEGVYRLTLKQKQKILINNIYGVDLDQQAVEVTQLSLYLKLLEDETTATANDSWVMFKEKLLPDLNKNIVCGNSLIGTDILSTQTSLQFQNSTSLTVGKQTGSTSLPLGKQTDSTSLPLGKQTDSTSLPFLKGGTEGGFNAGFAELKLKPMDFETTFPEVMKNGGFDAIVGNPPYVRQELISGLKKYFEKKYKVYHGIADLYAYFIERAITLLKHGGYFSYIVANKWMRANYGLPLREWLLKQNLIEVIDFGDLPVFKDASTYPCILTVNKVSASEDINVTMIDSLDFKNLEEVVRQNSFTIKKESLQSSGWNLVNDEKSEIVNKLFNQGMTLESYVDKKIFRGILTGLNKAFVIDAEIKNQLIKDDPKSAEIIKPFLAGRDIKRYEPTHSDKFLIFTKRGIDISKYKIIEEYLKKFKEQLIPKPKNWKGKEWKGRKPGSYKWYEIQDTIDYYKEFEKPKLMLPDISLRGNFTFDSEGGFYCVNTAYIISSTEKYLLGILNSQLMNYCYRSISSTYRGGYLRYIYQYLSQLPIIKTEKESPVYTKIESLVEQILTTKKQLRQTKTASDKNYLERKCETLDRQIDSLVYELYGLTEEEIGIVEGR